MLTKYSVKSDQYSYGIQSMVSSLSAQLSLLLSLFLSDVIMIIFL